MNEKAMPHLLRLRAVELAKRGRLVDVAQAGAKLWELMPKTIANLYNAVCAYALCSAILAGNTNNVTVVAEAEERTLINNSLACLKDAIAEGVDDFERMKKDVNLRALHLLPEFEQFIPPGQ